MNPNIFGKHKLIGLAVPILEYWGYNIFIYFLFNNVVSYDCWPELDRVLTGIITF